MFYEWSLKKRCIRWETLHYDEVWKHQRMKNDILQYDRTGTNMFYEWSLKKRCIRWETLHYDEVWKHQRMKNE